ncbi:MAG: helix-turn-helix transcriptional regulator [Firmicutes bacterium]|nr:helix-turn-helix transcriptional regulator [Bacillota bacterium]
MESEDHTEELITKAIDYMRDNLDQVIRIDDIAGHVGLSPKYLCYRFKQTTGQTLMDYLTDLRIKRAKRLLANGSQKVRDVASAVGYRDEGYFSRVFSKRVGLPPGRFRSQFEDRDSL